LTFVVAKLPSLDKKFVTAFVFFCFFRELTAALYEWMKEFGRVLLTVLSAADIARILPGHQGMSACPA